MSSRSTSTASTTAAAAAAAAPFTLQVIDPLNRTGKISVPSSQVTMTRGLQDHFDAEHHGIVRRTVKDLSLCLLFLKGRCGADAYCNQIHVNADFIADVRKKAECVSNCCAKHGDVNASSFVGRDDAIIEVGGRRYTLPQCARTDGLDTILRQAGNSRSAIFVPTSKVCRLQQDRRCKFGRDCKYVHLCRECGFFDAPAPMVAAAASRTPVVSTPPPLARFERPAASSAVRAAASPAVVDANELSLTTATPIRAPAPLAQWSSPASSVASPPLTARHSVRLDDDTTELKSMRAGDFADFDSFMSCHTTAAPPALDFSVLSTFVDDLSNAKVSPLFASPLGLQVARC